MRSLCILLGILLAVAACAPEPAPADAAGPPDVRAVVATGPALSLVIDSLLIDEPTRSYRVAVGYPQIHGTAGEPMSATLRAVNAAIADSVEALAADFRPEAPPAGMGPSEYPVTVEGGTTRRFLTDDVLSVLVEVYAYTGGAHGTTVFLPLTFDLQTGAALAPPDLFAAGTPWADTLAAYVERGAIRQITRQSGEVPPGGFYAEGLDPLRAGRLDLTVSADSVTVHVPPYQLSAYAAGPFQVGVPLRAVAPFARGALARLAEE